MASGGLESFWLNFGGGVELKLNSKIAQRFINCLFLFACGTKQMIVGNC